MGPFPFRRRFRRVHISLGGLAILERVLSSAMLVFVLGWVCYRTPSIYPGILLHVIHNGLLITLARYKDQIQEIGFVKALGWNPENESHLPAGILLLAGLLAAGGAALVWLGSRRRQGQGETGTGGGRDADSMRRFT